MALPGETEAGSAGKQPCPGIVRRAHRDDDHGRGNERLAPTLHPIGSKDPDALKIPARRAASTLTRSVRSPVLAEPAHDGPANPTAALFQAGRGGKLSLVGLVPMTTEITIEVLP